jgi:hypothetical protein
MFRFRRPLGTRVSRRRYQPSPTGAETGAIAMHTNTLLPTAALIALVAAGPLAWAQDSHGANASDDTKPSSQAEGSSHPDNSTVAMAAGQTNPLCNDRNGTVACSAKSIPHEPEPGVPPVNPAAQAPAPAQ